MSDTFWAAEEAFWTAASAEALRQLDPVAIMVFGPVGILQGAEIPPTIRDAPRWDSVEMTDRHLSDSDDITVLAYRATARRGDQVYAALCSSTWIRRVDGWRILSHQQTPLPSEG